jgi:lipopolysaccharide/colanic/teichoic acid biosynthesis glycosyltransferase
MWYAAFKRLFDIVCSSLGLLVLAPGGLLLALLVKLSDRGPIFYGQTRIGQFGRPFRIWKFRSMVINADKIGAQLTKDEDPRITWIGRFLRKTKLDELPQLWNVLIGDMSLVGPRPEVPYYVNFYTPEQREILIYKPGITDMATVQFRNEEALLRGAPELDDFYVRHCLPKKIELNRRYAQRASLLQDIWIILQTVCPYWLGVLLLYAVILVASLWFSFELRFDFRGTPEEHAEFRQCLPWMVLPQLGLLVWRRQCRGLVSYFSFLEVLQLGAALGAALLIHFAVRYFSNGLLAPAPGIIGTDFGVSFWGITWGRLFLKFVREGHEAKLKGLRPRAHRVAIVGAGELGTKVALDLLSRDVPVGVVAFFDDDPRSWNKRPYDIPVVGMPECLLNAEWLDRVDEVIVALEEEDAARLRTIGQIFESLPLKVTFASDWPGRSNDHGQARTTGPLTREKC